uniref:Uncharacterized protein n=1 Tax=Panagrolaimus superbus TaxID=310955 RepID=A0A914ZCJ4_9BILA
MTSRRYSELSNASNMSLIDEGDENSTPVVGDNSTPRAKLVPMKKTRISDSPLTSRQQNMAFKGDKNLEETFVEQSFLAAPLVAESEMQTLVKDITQQLCCFCG